MAAAMLRTALTVHARSSTRRYTPLSSIITNSRSSSGWNNDIDVDTVVQRRNISSDGDGGLPSPSPSHLLLPTSAAADSATPLHVATADTTKATAKATEMLHHHHHHRTGPSFYSQRGANPIDVHSSSLCSNTSSSRHFSTTTATTAGTTIPPPPNGNTKGKEEEKEEEDKKKKTKGGGNSNDSTGNIFLDHIGKIFLLGIASIVGTLIRGSYNTTNRNKVRDTIEEIISMLDPMEIDDLRVANTELTVPIFTIIVHDIYNQYYNNPSSSSSSNYSSSSSTSSTTTPKMTYTEFVKTVRRTMIRLKGEEFTIELGHLLDRVVVSMLRHYTNTNASSKTKNDTTTTNTTATANSWNTEEGTVVDGEEPELPISMWLTVLSLALNSTIDERIQMLQNILVLEQQQVSTTTTTTSSNDEMMMSSSYSEDENQQQQQRQDKNDNNTKKKEEQEEIKIPLSQIYSMIGYLQESFQLPPDTQVVKIVDEYIPTQQFRRGTPKELVQLSLEDSQKEQRKSKKNKNGGKSTDTTDTYLTSEEFELLLKSRMICAWGECYHKKKQ